MIMTSQKGGSRQPRRYPGWYPRMEDMYCCHLSVRGNNVIENIREYYITSNECWWVRRTHDVNLSGLQWWRCMRKWKSTILYVMILQTTYSWIICSSACAFSLLFVMPFTISIFITRAVPMFYTTAYYFQMVTYVLLNLFLLLSLFLCRAIWCMQHLRDCGTYVFSVERFSGKRLLEVITTVKR